MADGSTVNIEDHFLLSLLGGMPLLSVRVWRLRLRNHPHPIERASANGTHRGGTTKSDRRKAQTWGIFIACRILANI
eukprot:scaffold2791_cov154-Amphora_coffeaeformis.AAC.5